jgi:putative component of toxin-antitoxin plasmid stabilization module
LEPFHGSSGDTHQKSPGVLELRVNKGAPFSVAVAFGGIGFIVVLTTVSM